MNIDKIAINKIENEWDQVRPQLEELFHNIDIYDMERLSHDFIDSLEYLSAMYGESPLALLNKISPLFSEEVRKLLEKYITQQMYPWLTIENKKS
ncbi:hypothetical protein IM40_03765 [Candidatus Paracaedimonas acanthamoebae]|nr:hypothetical protein IM40_03765 [Candidatus Paracaedimonas acanthamoebae]